jgi:hypothetical protein
MAKILILSPCDTTNLNHGGKIDLLGILNFLKEIRHETFLVAIDRSNQVTSEGISAKRLGYYKYLFSFSQYPYIAYSRKISKTQLRAIREFEPEIIILMSEFMLPAYLQLRDMKFTKVVLRRVNNEYLYLRSLLSIRNPVLSLYRTIELLKMNHLQKSIMKQQIDLTLDIAATELPAPSKIIVSGPLNSKQSKTNKNPEKEIYDFGYIGNLALPNARHGINWFLDSVVPKILVNQPQTRILIAGKSPSSSLKKKCKRNGIIILANPAEVDHLYMQIKIFVNPVFKGSGINMKLITPIEFKKPIVTTSFGSRGFPEIDQIYGVGDTVDSFTRSCLKIFNNYDESVINADKVLIAYKTRVDKVYEFIKSELNTEQF